MSAADRSRRAAHDDADDQAARLEELQARWPAERPSRRRKRRDQRRKSRRGPVTVKATRLAEPDGEHMSRALLAAQRELARAQAEADASQQQTTDAEDTAHHGEGR